MVLKIGNKIAAHTISSGCLAWSSEQHFTASAGNQLVMNEFMSLAVAPLAIADSITT
jgi:hypothetical protein